MQMYISMHFLTLYVTLKTSKYIRNIIFKKFFQSKKCKNSSEKCEEDFIISLFSRPLVWFWPRPYGLKGVWMMPFFRMGTRGLVSGLTASMTLYVQESSAFLSGGGLLISLSTSREGRQWPWSKTFTIFFFSFQNISHHQELPLTLLKSALICS